MCPTFYRGCWHVVSRHLFLHYRPFSSCRKGLYDPKTFITHAASLHQGFPHCAIFLIAASRRSRGRVSVPVRRIILSDPLPVVALVGRYPANKLIGREALPKRSSFFFRPCDQKEVSGISSSFLGLSQTSGQVPHVLLTRSPLGHSPEGEASLDLHVLSTPPAFVLSQDQTLRGCL